MHSLSSSRLLTAAAATAFAIGACVPVAADAAWRVPARLGSSGPYSGAPRIGLSPSGADGVVAWPSSSRVTARAFTGGRLQKVTFVPGDSVQTAARDGAHHSLVVTTHGRTPDVPDAEVYIVGRWQHLSIAKPRSVDVGQAFGLGGGFVIPTITTKGSGTQFATATVRSAQIGVDGAVDITDGVDTVYPFDQEHGYDGTAWALAGDAPLTIVNHVTGRGENAPTTEPGLAVLAQPSLRDPSQGALFRAVAGVPGFDAAAVDASGTHVVAAGLDVQLSGDAGQRGVPAFALGTAAGLGPATRIAGVPDRRAITVDVAATSDGGAYVTWLQKTTVAGFSTKGQPHWARVSAEGVVAAQGVLDTDVKTRDLRVVQSRGGAFALWVRGDGKSSTFKAAKLTQSGATPVPAPRGAPMGRVYADTTTQLVSRGGRLALVFVDARTSAVMLATQQAP